jgi:glycosyltransferase involved in cell wall biosynthesis
MINAPDRPIKISIVMPSYNQAAFVEAALLSIISQDYNDWEILFIDAGSTDGTLEIVERYREHITYFISEPDNGQSDAIHKGCVKATGNVLTWLNTDDLLLPGTLQKVARSFIRKPSCNWILGNVAWIDSNDKILKCWRGEGYTPGWLKLGLFAAGGPSSFFKRDLYHRVGGINLDLHYQMDTELWWRFAMAGESFYRLNGYTWALRLHDKAKVSGHMFFDPSDEKQIKISELQKKEKLYISRKTNKFFCKVNPTFKMALNVLRRLTSPQYLIGLFDNIRFSGRNIYSCAPGNVNRSLGRK